MLDVKIKPEDLNATELRLMARGFSYWPPRSYDHEKIQQMIDEGAEPSSDQLKRRTRVEAFVLKNWKYIKNSAQVYGCTADCSKGSNRCTDARANTCYRECFPKGN
ncbi:MAG: hypothetical protein CL678_11740 [Bdellovibrionaceae bacterium]|nr:hypothetical protein [Pseudobdellovibrionaceae bacterium]|tara:strand:+ start:141 stop:458 length:318 start_codon:yes stop_codon:yes gene_type:complete